MREGGDEAADLMKVVEVDVEREGVRLEDTGAAAEFVVGNAVDNQPEQTETIVGTVKDERVSKRESFVEVPRIISNTSLAKPQFPNTPPPTPTDKVEIMLPEGEEDDDGDKHAAATGTEKVVKAGKLKAAGVIAGRKAVVKNEIAREMGVAKPVARKRTGNTAVPAPSDDAWTAWTDVIRRTSPTFRVHVNRCMSRTASRILRSLGVHETRMVPRAGTRRTLSVPEEHADEFRRVFMG
ncbi:hypothetical protein HK101_004292, partial [Irineochytrium annulatum]